MADRIADPWGERTPYGRGEDWPVRVDTLLEDEGAERWVQSASTLHSNGDGFDLAVKDGHLVGIRGRKRDRVSHGRLDPKDLYGWKAVESPDRLTRELHDGPGGWGHFGFYTTGQLFSRSTTRSR